MNPLKKVGKSYGMTAMQISLRFVISLVAVRSLYPVSVLAYEIDLKEEVQLTYTSPKETWENKPIEATCSWKLQVGKDTWYTQGDPGVTADLWADFGVYSNKNLGLAPHEIKMDKKVNLVPAGAHSPGKVFSGQLSGSFVPQKPGPWTVACVLSGQSVGNNNLRSWSPMVYRPKPFTPEEIPVPEVVAPLKSPGGEIIQLSLDASGIALTGRISPTIFMGSAFQYNVIGSGVNEYAVPGECTSPGKSFWEWATKCTVVFEERWHLELLKRQTSGMFKPVQTFSGPVTQQEYQRIVSPGIFNIDQDGGGIWRLKTWLTQEKTPQGVVSGKASIVDFEVKLLPKKPLVAKSGSPIFATKPQPKSPPTAVAKPSPGIVAALARPNLSTTGVQVKIESNCKAPQPAMTAIVTLKNSGGPLSANKGTVLIKEQGGTNLGSAGLQLPAIGAGQTQNVNIPAITLQPYSSLAGVHQLQVFLNPQSEGGQLSFSKPTAPYIFSATFPSGHCISTQRQPMQPQPKPALPGRR